MLLRYALRELLNHRRFVFFFVLNLSLGLAGFVILMMTRDALQNHFGQKLRDLLTADFQISTRESVDEPTFNRIDALLQDYLSNKINKPFRLIRSTHLETVSVLQAGNYSKLVRVLGVDEHFPLYGQWRIHRDDPVPERTINGNERFAQLYQQQEIWLDQATAWSLGLKLGQSVTIGQSEFLFAGVVDQHPARSLGFSALLPTVYVARDHLAQSGLLTTGSRWQWRLNYRIEQLVNAPPPRLPSSQQPSGALPSVHYAPIEESPRLNALISDLQKDWIAQLSSAIQKDEGEASLFAITVPAQSNERIQNLIEQFSGSLNLISLIGLFFSGLGLFYLYRYFMLVRLPSLAIAQTLGMSRWQAFGLWFWQLLILTALALLVALMIGMLWQTLGLAWVGKTLGLELQSAIQPWTLLAFGALTLLTVVVFTLPIMVAVRALKPLVLLRLLPGEIPNLASDARYGSAREKRRRRLAILPALMLLWFCAVGLVGVSLGSLFFAGLMAVIGAIVMLGNVAINLLHRYCGAFNLSIRLSVRALYGRKSAVLSGLLAIGLGAFLMALLPPLVATLREEARTPRQSALPTFFLFDIQSEQMAPLQSFVAKQQSAYPQIRLMHLSPQIRARLTHINDQSINDINVRERIEAGQRQFIAQGVNLSFRDQLTATETLVAGTPIKTPTSPTEPIEISLEERFSQRLGVQVGDRLTFWVHGVVMNTRVTNIRKVHWNSFQPNFFIEFPSGVLESAPKTWVANLSGIPPDHRQSLQAELARAFPNISAIDVGGLVEEVLTLANQVVLAVYGLAMIALITGLTVLGSVAHNEVESATSELALIKVLGANRAQTRMRILVQFVLPTAFFMSLGVLLALLLIQSLAQAFLQTSAVIVWRDIALLLGLMVVMVLPIFFGLNRKVYNIKPLVLLNAD